MRITPRTRLAIGERLLGGPLPLICVPLVGRNASAIREEVRNLTLIAPDIIEVRVDAWDCVENTPGSLSLLREIRAHSVGTPLILTCRGHWEGGFKKVTDQAKFALYDQAVQEGLADFIDVELAYGDEKLREIKKQLAGSQVSLIISSHDFQKTPNRDVLFATLAAQIRAGADVAKLAVMPQREEDVLTLLSATLAIRREYPDVSLITMSMGETGAISRIMGGLFGSDLTFAVGSAASAPGQIPIAEMRQLFATVYK